MLTWMKQRTALQVADGVDVGGVYLADCRVREDVAPYATDDANAAALWELTETLCNG